jgi:drug/metabolite transporter (DMT)-like permease
MKQLSFETLIAVFEELYGAALFWTLVGVAALITLGYLYVLIRDHKMSMRRFLWAQLSMPFGAIAAVLFVQAVTHSDFRDLGGPVDWIVMLAVAVLGAGGSAILVYTLQSLLRTSPFVIRRRSSL